MADPIDELNAVLMTIGITNQNIRTNIIEREGFTELADLATLVTDRDVDEMAKRMAARTQNEGRVFLGTVTVQRMKTLVWWVNDQLKRGIDLQAVNFTPEVMKRSAQEKIVRAELADTEPTITDLGKFDPDDFDTYEDAFLNLLGQTFGVLKEPLRYVVRPTLVPEEFANNQEERMYQLPLEGNAFDADNHSVYRFTANLKHSSLTPLDGLGLSPMTPRKTVVLPLRLGRITTMGRENLASGLLLPRPSLIKFITETNEAYPLKNALRS